LRSASICSSTKSLIAPQAEARVASFCGAAGLPVVQLAHLAAFFRLLRKKDSER